MAFDEQTRRRLSQLVLEARRILEAEFTAQLQVDYGMDPVSGDVAPVDQLTRLDDRQRETARILRDTLGHYCAEPGASLTSGLQRIVREQAFTVLNRLAALRLAEARGIIVQSVGKGFQATGFQLYQRLATGSLGETGETYRSYLQSVFDDLSHEIPILFDRFSPKGRLFPREKALTELIVLLEGGEIESLWAEDETIGWIYQYFNSKEERREMREASPAPRNSRELAVRNQFFTPRYVVEFLVDNTLGQLWFNCTGGRTALRDRCQYILVKPEDKPRGADRLRDPRTIKLLDPACGSMHFGLYAFDLFEVVYREAWAWERANGVDALDRGSDGANDLRPLSESYVDEDAFLHDVPRLIIEHNIYGVDIDPRAAQIASLALWLRAQRAWHEARLKAKDRPQVGHGHVVAAVAPPAELSLRERLMEQLDPLDAKLFEQTLLMLRGLPQLGVLLQVEKELPALVRKVFGEHGDLFHAENLAQWQKAEARLRNALSLFSASQEATFRRRLFVEDTLEGLKVVDMLRERFDVAVMNPPFGPPPDNYQSYSRSIEITNMYTAFFERMKDLNVAYIGAITDRTFVVQPTFEDFRSVLLDTDEPINALADLGWGVLDANVQVCAFTVSPETNELCGFVDVRDVEHKSKFMNPKESNWRWKKRATFKRLPKQVLAYAIPNEILDLYDKCVPLESVALLPRGLGSNMAERTFRAWVEVPMGSIGPDKRWASLANGGEYSPFCREDLGVAEWHSVKGFQWTAMTASDPWRPYDQSGTENYFVSGLAFPKQSQRFNVAALPAEYVPTREGKAVLPYKREDALSLLAYLNSGLVGSIVRDTCGLHKQGKAIGSIPVVGFEDSIKEKIGSRALRLTKATKYTYSFDETSRHFLAPLGAGPREWSFDEDAITNDLDEIESLVRASIYVTAEVKDWLDAPAFPVPYRPSNEDILAWAVGVAFGRFDWRVATGEREAPIAPDVFDPLPIKSPGMLPDGLAPFHGHGGILVDDKGHEDDLARLIEEVLACLQSDAPNDIRLWLKREFFKIHLMKYSIARRKAPIYWPLSTSSGGYTLWIYYPNLTKETLYVAVNDFVEPKLKQVGHEIVALRNMGADRSREDQKVLEARQAFELELIELRDILLSIAPSYHPNQDDGVQITAAPLWQLFRNKPWQKLLKDTWAKLEKGDYDWAHLAIAYWPDRVREKCETDKSLAIAHDLQHLYAEPSVAPKKAVGRKRRGPR